MSLHPIRPCSLRLPFALLFLAAAAAADERHWKVGVTPILVETQGNDPNVLAIVRPGSGSEGVALEADDGLGYRAEVRYERPVWSWGVDFFWYRTDQVAGPLAMAGGDPPVAFELPGRQFFGAPGETLEYSSLEDTTIETWAASAFAARPLVESERGALGLRLGLKVSDFDNDYRAFAGERGGAGLRLDASSNYDRMQGPLVGLEGRLDFGRSRIEAVLDQSVVFTSVELSWMYRDFIGPHAEEGPFTNPRGLSESEDVTIPITELRLAWIYQFTDAFALGLSAEASSWWDLPLPPGIVPEDGAGARREETVTFVAYGATATLRF